MVEINPIFFLDFKNRIIKSTDAQKYIEFSKLQTYAQGIIDKAVQEAEYLCQKAVEDGFAQGLKAAEQEIHKKIFSINAEKVNFFSELEQQLPELVLSLVHRVINDFDDANKLASLTHEVLSKLKNDQHISIRINSTNLDSFTEALSHRVEQSAFSDFLSIQPDNDIPLHQCHVEFHDGLYILDWKKTLQLIEEQMTTSNAFTAK